jgi:hypothetical protein
MTFLIRTRRKDEATAPAPNKQPLTYRYWETVELLSEIWFLVEASVETSGDNKIQRFITTSIQNAAAIEKSLQPYWCTVYVCLRAPLNIRNATVFEVVQEAHASADTGLTTYHLANGMTFALPGESVPEVEGGGPKRLQRIYASKDYEGFAG